jgi:hypothetical protein
MAEHRCPHGFLRSAQPCPVCDGEGDCTEDAETDETPWQRARGVTDAQVIAALRSCGSLEGAARFLSISDATIRYRAKRNRAVQLALNERRVLSRHPAFVDLTGLTFDSWTVIREAAPSANGNTRWLCRHDCEFGGELIMEGIRLRDKPRKFCDDCRAGGVKRAG